MYRNERCDELANEARTGAVKSKERAEAIAKGETVIGTKRAGVICLWHAGKMKVIDLFQNVCEDYKREIHGPRGSFLEVREEKSR